MRQASWIAFLLLAVGLLSYDAALDQQEATASGPPEMVAADGGTGEPPPPKP